jgi:hypothetical protein
MLADNNPGCIRRETHFGRVMDKDLEVLMASSSLGIKELLHGLDALAIQVVASR